jgi:hypothetical protein
MTYTEYKPYVIDTGYLFPPSLADFLGDEEEVYIFREVTEQLDISCVDSDFNGILGAWVTTVFKILVSAHGDARKRKKVRANPLKMQAFS